MPIYTGGLVGYFRIRHGEIRRKTRRESEPPDVIGTPDILLMVSQRRHGVRQRKGLIHLITHANPADEHALDLANQRLEAMRKNSDNPFQISFLPVASALSCERKTLFQVMVKKSFKADVDKIKEYILAGDVMQVVLSQRMAVKLEASPLDLYRALRSLNPSPYMYYMNLDDFHIVSSSPEILARLDNGQVTVRPLAGTRRRGMDEAEDKALETELLADPKEIAEHLMLIDLGQ